MLFIFFAYDQTQTQMIWVIMLRFATDRIIVTNLIQIWTNYLMLKLCLCTSQNYRMQAFVLINTYYEKKPNKLCFMCQEEFKANLLQLFWYI